MGMGRWKGRQGCGEQEEQGEVRGGGLGGERRMKGRGVQGAGMQGCTVRDCGVQDEAWWGAGVQDEGCRGKGQDGGVKCEGLWGAGPGAVGGLQGAG